MLEPLTEIEDMYQLQAIGLPLESSVVEADEYISCLEFAMLNVAHDTGALTILDLEPTHRFAEGIYTREVTLPAGALLTSRWHKEQHVCIVSKGDITVWSHEFGLQRIVAPASFVSSPGSRRVGMVHEETVWTTVHANPDNCRDIPTLEARLYNNPPIMKYITEAI